MIVDYGLLFWATLYKLHLHQSIPVIWKRHCEHRHGSPAHSSLSR